VMTAAPSCPEIVRLHLAGDAPLALEPAQVERLPHALKDYLPEALDSGGALAVHQAFIAACEDPAPPEIIFARIASVSRSLELIDQKSWPQAITFYLKHADSRLPVPESNPADPFNLLHALSGLIVASKKPMSDRLGQTVADMERALAVTLDWQQTLIHTSDKSADAYEALKNTWQDVRANYDDVLKRYLALELSLALYPFAGLGHNISERITILGVRLATVKLALMCGCGIYGPALPQDIVVRTLQSLSRFLDHLANPGFSLQIYAETGWTREARMRGLLEN
jgi:hypothetical protein